MRDKQFINSLFSQCNITLNGVTITHAADLYHYRAYLETLLNYGGDALTSYPTNAFWYHDNGDMGPSDTTPLQTRDSSRDGTEYSRAKW